MALPDDLVDHLTRTSRLSRIEAEALVREVISYFDESLETFVARRHAECKRDGLGNTDIFRLIAHEAERRRFPVAPLSERQVRRLIYG